MKNKLLAFILAMSCISATGYAKNIANISNQKGVISVKGNTAPDITVTLVVKDVNDSGELFAIKETVSDENGDYSFNFTLRKNEIMQDEYRYMLLIKGDEEFADDIVIFSKAVTESFSAAIKEGKLKELLDDEEKFELAESFGLDIKGYMEIEGKNEAISAFYTDAILENITDEEIADIFNKEILLYKSKSANKDEYLAMLGEDFDKKQLSDFTVRRLYETKEYNSIKEYEVQIRMFEALNEVNNAKYSQLEALFENNKEILGLGSDSKYSTYTALSDTNKRTVNESVVSALLKKPAETTDEFISIFNTMVAGVENIRQNSGSSGGGSSGNGIIAAPITSDNVLPEKQKVFSDVELDFWAEEDIRILSEAGIISGYGDGTFGPEKKINREEFVTILINAFNLQKKGAMCSFEDVSENDWFYPFVASACEIGAVSGISDDSFGTGRNISRQEAAAMIARITGISDTDDERFADDALIADYAKEAVYGLKKLGVISGRADNSFAPFDECTRAECARMIRVAMEL